MEKSGIPAGKQGWLGHLRRAACMAAGAYVLLVLALYCLQGGLMYPGSEAHHNLRLDDPETQGRMKEAGAEVWRDGRGNYLGFRRENPETREAWLIFYGNGDHAAHALSFFKAIRENLPGREMACFVMEYPGYGPRPGTPGERALVEAARQAFEAVHARYPAVYVLGQSLGAGVAAQLIGLHPREVAGAVLLTPFDRMSTSAKVQVGRWFGAAGACIPVSLLLRDTYDSLGALQGYRGPLAVVSGGRDTLTPAAVGKRLADQAGANGRFWLQEENGHWADLAPVPQCRELFAFVAPVPLEGNKP
jgi:pimeloyl-ACP methyl ester carboxylesterase